MSFSGDVRREISRMKSEKECCRLAELSALLLTCGRIVLKGRMRLELSIVLQENNVAHKIIELAKSLYDINVDVCVSKSMRLKKQNKYIITFYESQSVRRLLEDTTILSENEEGFSTISHKDWHKLLKCENCSNAFLRGVFEGAGSVSDPTKYNHMEFVIYDADFAQTFNDYLNERDIRSKILERKGYYMVYLKDSECIGDVLRASGASSTLFDYENIRINKDIKNKVTRLMNCDFANQNKSIETGLRQKEMIEFVVSKKGWKGLPEPLRLVAELRCEDPGMSLAEMGEELDPPIGKSGVNHRLKKIQEMAEELGYEGDL